MASSHLDLRADARKHKKFKTNVAKLVVTCASECKSEEDYKNLRIFVKEKLKSHGLQNLVDHQKVVDTHSLFETVFINEHQLPMQRKLEILKDTMNDMGKLHVAEKVKQYLNQMRTSNPNPSDSLPSHMLKRSCPMKPYILQISRQLGTKWKNLARQLGFIEAEIDNIEHREKSLEQCSHKMLTDWCQKLGTKATKQKLIQALQGIDRGDLGELLEESSKSLYNTEMVSVSSPTQPSTSSVSDAEPFHVTSRPAPPVQRTTIKSPAQPAESSFMSQHKQPAQFVQPFSSSTHFSAPTLPKNGSITHVAIAAVGRTRVGKTSSVNNVMGTMNPNVRAPKDVHQFKSGKPYAHSYTRQVLVDSVSYKLTLVDTPGLGDNSTDNDALTDDDVCERIRWAIEPLRHENAQIMVVYFASAITNLDNKEEESIRKLEEAICIPVSCIVLTHAKSAFEQASLDWDTSKEQVQEHLHSITEEFVTDFKAKHYDDEDLIDLSEQKREERLAEKVQEEIKPGSDNLPTRRRTRQEFLHILSRRQLIEKKKQWYPLKLGRELPVMLIENKPSHMTESGVQEIYTTWIELLDEGAGLFHFMTGNLSEHGVAFDEKMHEEAPMTSTSRSTEANNSKRINREQQQRGHQTTLLQLPNDCTSPEVQQERNQAREGIRTRAKRQLIRLFANCCPSLFVNKETST